MRIYQPASLALPKTPLLSQTRALNVQPVFDPCHMVSTISFFHTIPPFAYIDSRYSSSSVYPGSDLWRAKRWRAEVNRGQVSSSPLPGSPPPSHSHPLSSRHPLSMGQSGGVVRSFADSDTHTRLLIPIGHPATSFSLPSPVTPPILRFQLIVSFSSSHHIVFLCSFPGWD